jgi:hypothetical protein
MSIGRTSLKMRECAGAISLASSTVGLPVESQALSR